MSSSAAGWTSAWFCGGISPIKSGVSMMVSASDGDLLCDCVNDDGLWANADGVGLEMTCASAGPTVNQDWLWRGNRVFSGDDKNKNEEGEWCDRSALLCELLNDLKKN